MSPEPTITLSLPLSQVNVILKHLSHGVYREVAVTIENVQGQTEPQLAPSEVARAD